MPKSLFVPAPVVLEGTFVRVEPLDRRHAVDLARAGADPSVWRWLMIAPPENADPDERTRWFAGWIDSALREQAAAQSVPFAIVRRDDGRTIGSTRYMSIRPEQRGLEIGWTWLGPEAQRTPINTETKLLLLAHAFETLDAIRVELKTDSLNERSRRAMERIGCTFEGVFRAHMIRRDGSLRDSAFYSITGGEWPSVRAHIEGLLCRSG